MLSLTLYCLFRGKTLIGLYRMQFSNHSWSFLSELIDTENDLNNYAVICVLTLFRKKILSDDQTLEDAGIASVVGSTLHVEECF